MNALSPLVVVHVSAGGLALVAGFAALALRKGERLHRAFGTLFFGAMLVMTGFAVVVAMARGQLINIEAGAFTFYLVTTAWMTIRRPENVSGRFEIGAMLAALAVAAIGVGFGLKGADAPKGMIDGIPYQVAYGFAGLAAFAALMDLTVILRRGLAGPDRISRHVWRMCLALFVAAGSFFFGQADEIPKALRGAHLAIPPFAVLAAMIFWLLRVRFSRAYRSAAAGLPRAEGARLAVPVGKVRA